MSLLLNVQKVVKNCSFFCFFKFTLKSKTDLRKITWKVEIEFGEFLHFDLEHKREHEFFVLQRTGVAADTNGVG